MLNKVSFCQLIESKLTQTVVWTVFMELIQNRLLPESKLVGIVTATLFAGQMPVQLQFNILTVLKHYILGLPLVAFTLTYLLTYLLHQLRHRGHIQQVITNNTYVTF